MVNNYSHHVYSQYELFDVFPAIQNHNILRTQLEPYDRAVSLRPFVESLTE